MYNKNKEEQLRIQEIMFVNAIQFSLGGKGKFKSIFGQEKIEHKKFTQDEAMNVYHDIKRRLDNGRPIN